MMRRKLVKGTLSAAGIDGRPTSMAAGLAADMAVSTSLRMIVP